MFICHKKMKNVNIMGVHQFLGEGIGGGGGGGGGGAGGGAQKIYMGNCLKMEASTIWRGLGKK